MRTGAVSVQARKRMASEKEFRKPKIDAGRWRRMKIIFFDLDGTLLDDQKQIPKENLEALAWAAARGILIVPCTGRFFRGVPEPLRALPFLRYAITMNGAEVFDVAQGTALCRAEIPMAQAEAVFDAIETLPALYDCYQDGWGWMPKALYDRAEEFLAGEQMQFVMELHTPLEDFRGTLRQRGRPLQKIQLFFKDQACRLRQLERLPVQFPHLQVTTALPNNIELNSWDANKGHALEQLCRCLQISVQDVMALGDGLNDVSMLRTAGLGIAMGNAADAVKQAAGNVTGDNNHAGVAQAIYRYCD